MYVYVPIFASCCRDRVAARGLAGWLCALILAPLGAGDATADEPAIVFASRQFARPLSPSRVERRNVVERAFRGRLLVREPDGSLRALVDASRREAPSDTPIDVSDPDVSFDGTRVVFAGFSPGDEAWRLYEVFADGSRLRRITRSDREIDLQRFGDASQELEGYDDTDPCYLPDGRICFVSTRYPGIAPDERLRSTNLYVVNADGTDLQRITAERFGADTPAVDPRTGSIVYSRWWRSPPAADRGPARDPEPVAPGSTGYGSFTPPPDPTSPLILGGIDIDEFPGLNHWFLAAIEPDGSGLRMFTGRGLDRRGTQAYRPAFSADGTVVGLFLPVTPFLGTPGVFGLRLFRRGAVAPVALGGPQEFAAARRNGSFAGGGQNGFFYASAAPLPDGRILVAAAPAGSMGLEYDIYVQEGDGRPFRLHGEPGTAEVDATPLVARNRPPAAEAGARNRMDDFVPYDPKAAARHGGTFTFLCENVFSNPPVDSPLPGTLPVGKRLFIEFYMNPQRESPRGADEPILIDRREIPFDGRIEAELPAGVPLFEVIRRADERVALGRDGQVFHVGGHNFGARGTTNRCVGCHAGHSMLEIPEEPAWSNLAPSAVVTANSSRPPEGFFSRTGTVFFSPGNLTDRSTEPRGSIWTARPSPGRDRAALPVSEITLRWPVPIAAREVVVYGVPPDPLRKSDLLVRSLRLTTEAGGEVRQALVLSEVRPEGTSAVLEAETPFDTLRITIESSDVRGTLDGIPSLPALAEVEVRSRVVEPAPPSAIFLRSDANCDASFNIADPIAVLEALFVGEETLCCAAAADVNGDHGVNLTDAIRTLEYLFFLGEPPPPPFPKCGRVPEGALSCDKDTCR